MREFHWSLVSEDEWQAECQRRWSRLAEEVHDPIDDGHDDELDRLMADDLRWA